MSAVLMLETALEQTSCCVCGIVFALPTARMQKLREEEGSFFCPNGHSLTFNAQWLCEKLARLEREKQEEIERRQRAEATADRLFRQAKGARTQARNLRKRIAAGVCPCCHRTFKKLAQHMGTKHPHYAVTEISPGSDEGSGR